jgi:cellobiose-specific phosphotransferase system component IIA
VAKEHWDDGEYNDAYDAFVAARNAYERALDVARERDIEAASQIREKADEVTTDIDDLSKSPLQLAEDAHERAMGVDDPTEAVERYEEALEKYQEAMVLDWGNDQQRFAGDSDRIREHVESIVDEIVSSRRTLAEQSRELGEGFMSEGQYERARAQFAQARDEVEAAYSVAEELRPGLTTDLSTDIRDLEERMETAVEQAGTAGFQFVGDVEDPTAPSSRPLTRQLTDLDEEAFDALVAGLWEDMDWQTSHGHEGPVDVLATRSDPIPERQLVLTVHCDGDDTCGADAIEAAVDVRDSDRDVDVVTVVTNGTCSDEARTMADEHNVKLVEGDQLTDLLDAEDLGDVTGTNQQPAAE